MYKIETKFITLKRIKKIFNHESDLHLIAF